MASLRTFQLTLCLASLLAAVPTTAEACSPDPCYFDFAWITAIAPVNHAAVANDGVLVLQADMGGQNAFGDLAAALTLEVTREGQPVPGALENTDVPGVLIWRPGEPLLAGATYDVAGSFKNSAEAAEFGCGEAELPLAFEFAAVDAAEPLAAPTVAAEAAATILESRELADLVCCDGAFPEVLECGGAQVFWTAGACAADKGVGWLDLQVTAASPLDPATAAMLATSIRVGDMEVYRGLAPQHTLRRDTPTCIVVEQILLSTGEKIAAAEQCLGADLVDDLGPQILDPAVVLADQCTGPLYTCEVAEGFPEMWDETKCTDLDPPPVDSEGESSDSDSESSDSDDQPTTSASAGESDSSGEPEGSSSGDAASDGEETDDSKQGCACNSGAPDPAGLLGLVVLAALARRRRR